MKKLKRYLELQRLSVPAAADQIGCTKSYVYMILKGEIPGKNTALKIEKWSKGFISAAELMKL